MNVSDTQILILFISLEGILKNIWDCRNEVLISKWIIFIVSTP